jgi:hypothetical protein
MLEPDWLASNAYRVLGVALSSRPKDIHEAATSLRRSATLGLLKPLATDPADLEPPNRGEDDVRAAVGRLENPTQRLQDRLFWFNGAAAAEAAPNDPARAHDTALLKLIGAVNAGIDDDAVDLWADALRAWNSALSSEAYWDWFQGVEIEADPEPPALPSEIDALRARATSLGGSPLVSLGRTALASSDVVLAAKVAACLDGLSATGAWATIAVSELCEPTLIDVLARCEAVYGELEASVVREVHQAAHNARPCAAALTRFRNEVSPGLDLLRSLAPADSDALLRARDAAARCLVSIAAATTWTDDYIKADEIYREASALAEGTIAALSIAEALEGIQNAVQFQRLKSAQKRGGPSPKREETAHPGDAGRDAALMSFLELCDRVGSDLEGNLKRDAGAVAQNKGPCALALKRFQAEIKPALQQLLALAPEKNEIHLRAREGAARCLAAIASATTWTDDFVYAETLYNDAVVLAEGTMALGMILNALNQVTESANQQRFRGKAIGSAPGLFTLNGVGTTLYGRADPDPATGSYVATLYFVILMLPILPLARYRVIEHPGRRFQFLGKQPFRAMDRWWLGLASGGVALLVLWGAFQAQTSQSNTYVGAPPWSGAAASDTSAGAPGPTDANAAPNGSPAAAGAGADAPTEVAPGPAPDIQPDASRVAEIDGRLTGLKSQIDDTDRSMASLKSTLDDMKQKQDNGEDIDTSEYNSDVGEYNGLLEKRKDLTDQYNNLVAQHNNLITQP